MCVPQGEGGRGDMSPHHWGGPYAEGTGSRAPDLVPLPSCGGLSACSPRGLGTPRWTLWPLRADGLNLRSQRQRPGGSGKLGVLPPRQGCWSLVGGGSDEAVDHSGGEIEGEWGRRAGDGVQGTGLGVYRPESPSWPCYSLPVRPWAKPLTFLGP